MNWIPDSARVFQPFAKVWTPRTPDSSYDSFGVYPPPPVIVIVPLITESIGTSVILESASYWSQAVPAGSAESFGVSLSLHSATYTP